MKRSEFWFSTRRLTLYATLSAVVFVVCFPLIWALSTSLKPKSEIFAKKFPDRFFEMGISEMNMIGAAAGFRFAAGVRAGPDLEAIPNLALPWLDR